MSFFQFNIPNVHIAHEENKPQGKIDPRTVIIDGKDLIKLIEDNPDIPEGKTDKGIAQFDMWQPINYSPETGEMK